MKLGTQTGSLTNHIHSRAVIGQPEPTIGMGATLLCWTDRHAATIIEIRRAGNVLYITVREDTAKALGCVAFTESQSYEYTPNPNGRERTFRREKTGRWQSVAMNPDTGRMNKREGEGLRIGVREEYRDPSF